MTELRISELASSSGVPPTTLRYYEQVGLLSANRAPNGYRVYDERALERVRFIAAAKRLDLSLDSIRGLLGAWEDEPCRSVKARLRPMVNARLADAQQGIAALTELARGLRAGLQRLEALPDRDQACDPTCTAFDDPAADADADPPLVACSLSPPDQHDRLAEWNELLSTARIELTPDGVTADIPASRVAELTALIIAEQKCCSFFRFALVFRGPTAQLAISADDPARVANLLPLPASTARR